jgi:hypothetical protein
MPQVFNANPTVFAPAKVSRISDSYDLFLFEDTNDTKDDTTETEPIDQNEIFGAASRW